MNQCKVHAATRVVPLFVTLITSLTLLSGTVYAASPSEKTDLKPLVEFLSQSVRTISKPVHLYHWQNQGRAKNLRHETSAVNAAGWRLVVNASRIFFNDLTVESGSSFGNGLYFASDPVVSEGYGSGPGWALMEIVAPSGFRYLQINDPDDHFKRVKVPQIVEDVLARHDCGFNKTYFFEGLFSPAVTRSQKCADALKSVLLALDIDAIAYDYQSQYFSGCSSKSKIRNLAFILIRPDKLNPSTTHVYTAGTADFTEDRKRIESLFIHAGNDVLATYNGDPSQPEYMPVSIKASHVQESLAILQGDQSLQNGLHWPDLEGQLGPSDNGDWLRKNIFGCSEDQ